MTDADDRDDRVAEYPPDHPQGVDEYGVLSADQQYPEPFEERSDREEPDDDVHGERLDIQLSNVGGRSLFDDEAELFGEADIDVVRGEDDPGVAFIDRWAPASERVPPPAEEAAIHLVEE